MDQHICLIHQTNFIELFAFAFAFALILLLAWSKLPPLCCVGNSKVDKGDDSNASMLTSMLTSMPTSMLTSHELQNYMAEL